MAGVAARPGQVESPNGPVAPYDPEHEYAEGGHFAESDHEHAHGALHHHFNDMEQQRESTSLGMWSFLSTEVMMFGGLFFVYTLYRQLSAVAAHEMGMADPFAVGGHLLNLKLGTANTFVLLFSSLTMALAVHASQIKNRKRMLAFMAVTLVLGTTFLGIKAVEWHADYEEGLVPALNWEPEKTLEEKEHRSPGANGQERDFVGYAGLGGSGRDGSISTDDSDSPEAFEKGIALASGIPSPVKQRVVTGEDGKEREAVNLNHLQMYFVIYFCMTGLHAIHMVIGAGVLIAMMMMGARGAFEGGNDQPIELFGLYWHFVDIVWVFLFPLLYLVGGFRF